MFLACLFQRYYMNGSVYLMNPVVCLGNRPIIEDTTVYNNIYLPLIENHRCFLLLLFSNPVLQNQYLLLFSRNKRLIRKMA